MMSSVRMHVQCHLVKGKAHRIVWIPGEFAVEGKVLKLKEKNGTWNDRWVVEQAARDSAKPSDFVLARSQNYKKMRKMTDI